MKFILSVRFRFSFARCTATTTVYAPPTASARVFDTNLIIFIATRQNLSGLYRSRAAGPKLVREEKPISFPLDQLSLFSLSLLARIPLWKRSRSTRLFEEVRYHSIGKFQYGGLRNFRFTSFHKEEVDAAAIYAASLSLLEARKRATTTAGEGREKRRQARAFALRSNAWNVTMRN